MPDAERALANMEQEIARMTGGLGEATSTTQAPPPAGEVSGGVLSERGTDPLRRQYVAVPKGLRPGKGLRDFLLEQRADLTSAIAESRDRLRGLHRRCPCSGYVRGRA